MIIKHLTKAFNTFPLHSAFTFCIKKAGYSNKYFIKNENLIFEDSSYKMIAYFFLPEIRKTQNNAYQINKDSNVLSLVWRPRQIETVIQNEEVNKKPKQYEEKTSFSFRYHDLQQLLQVLPKSGLTASIERKRKVAHQVLTLADNQSKKAIQFTLKTMDEKSGVSQGGELNFAFAYSKHRIFEILLRKSLFELSGMGLIYQIKRAQQLDSPENRLTKEKEQIHKQVQEFYK